MNPPPNFGQGHLMQWSNNLLRTMSSSRCTAINTPSLQFPLATVASASIIHWVIHYLRHWIIMYLTPSANRITGCYPGPKYLKRKPNVPPEGITYPSTESAKVLSPTTSSQLTDLSCKEFQIVSSYLQLICIIYTHMTNLPLADKYLVSLVYWNTISLVRNPPWR